MEQPRNILDYSSPAEEHRRQQSAEDQRREALELYNLATEGERRPIASTFLRYGIFLVIMIVLAFLLPRRAFRWISVLGVIALAFWEGYGRWGNGRPSRW